MPCLTLRLSLWVRLSLWATRPWLRASVSLWATRLSRCLGSDKREHASSKQIRYRLDSIKSVVRRRSSACDCSLCLAYSCGLNPFIDLPRRLSLSCLSMKWKMQLASTFSQNSPQLNVCQAQRITRLVNAAFVPHSFVAFISRLVNRCALTKINSVTVGTEVTPVASCAEAGARGSIEDEQALLAVALWNCACGGLEGERSLDLKTMIRGVSLLDNLVRGAT